MNRAERRLKKRTDAKFAAAQRRLAHEGRYTQAAELLEKEGVKSYEDLTEDEKEDLAEQADQSRERW